jgi:hypothetical protein
MSLLVLPILEVSMQRGSLGNYGGQPFVVL